MAPNHQRIVQAISEEFFFRERFDRARTPRYGDIETLPHGYNPASSALRGLSAARDQDSHSIALQGWVVPDEARNERSGTAV